MPIFGELLNGSASNDTRILHGQPRMWCYTSRRFNPIHIDSASPDDKNPENKPLYEVRIIDNNYNTYREVMDVTMLALQISEKEAYDVAWEVDHAGSCVVAHAPKEDAEALAAIIQIIGIEVQVNEINTPVH
jgi:ATP-dependent Clp protease adapter protein ClpS